MDKKLLSPNSLNSNYKLTRAASFSELSTTTKNVFKQQYQSEAYGNLIKQYSCEQIFDQNSNISHFKVSHTLKSDNEEHTQTWKGRIPIHSNSNLKWSKETNKPYLQKQYSSPNECLALKAPDVNSRQIIAPATFIINKNTSKQSNIFNRKMLQNFEQPNNEKFNESTCQFKKPTLILKKSRFLKTDCNTQNEQTIDNNTVNNYIKQPKTLAICNNTNKEKPDTTEMKTKLRSLVKKEPKKENNFYSCSFLKFIILISLVVLIVNLLLNDSELSNEFCNPRFKFNEVSKELKNRIFGQDNAVDALTKHFKKKENQTAFDVLAFIGTTGVGKSYTAEIIKNNLVDTYNVLDYFLPFYGIENQAYTSLSVCHCNLIILENIKTDFISDSIQFIDKLNSQVNNYCILVIALFNTQEIDSYLKKTLDVNESLSMIGKKFKDINLQPTFVTFTTMNDESLVKCIKDAANYTNMELSDNDIEYVKNDLIKAGSGCKGANAKVQLVGNIKNLSDF